MCVAVEGDTVASVERAEGRKADALPWIAPGLVDLQVNGVGGIEFNDPTLNVERLERACGLLDGQGVTSFLATIVTDSHETLKQCVAAIATARETSAMVSRRVAGIHLEGPYLSDQDGPRGAHPRQHCRPPDWDEFQTLQEAARGQIRLLTVSPHFDGSAEFIRQVTESGVTVAIGHTMANSEQIGAAVDAGARLSTHLGDGEHPQLPRHPNYIWDQLAEDRLMASIIADGHHLPAPVVQTFVRAKTPERIILISDITALAGMPPGHVATTSLGDVEVLDDGRLVVAGQREYLAGASMPLLVGMANVMRFAKVSTAEAIAMASTRPAQLVSIPCGGLEPGAIADLILFDVGHDREIQLVATINAGECVWGNAGE